MAFEYSSFAPLRRDVSTYSLILLIAIAFVTYWATWITYTHTRHPLSKIPGPFWASVTRLWLVNKVSHGNIDKVERDLHKKYGPLVRLAPNEISCADPEAVRTIYSTQAPLSKTDFYPMMGEPPLSKHRDLFSVTDERAHAERQRIVNNVYNLSTVLSLERYIDNCTALFMQRMGEFADAERPMDLGEWLHWYAFDVIGELFFGEMFGFMKNAHDYESLIQSLDTLLPVFITAAVAPSYMRIFILTSSILNSAARKSIKAVSHLGSAARSGVAKRREVLQMSSGADQRRDLLQHLFDIMDTKGEKLDFGVNDVETEAYVAITAGSDTTAIALRACFYYLMKNPKIYKQVQAEIDEAASRGGLSSPVRYTEAAKLPLMCASVKEAMRLHPSVGLQLPRTTPKGGIEIAGEYFPGGWRIGMNAAVVGYNEDVYGPDAHQFRPSRWLEGNTARMERTSLVFGGGTRTCIGQNISLCEIHKLLPHVLRNFDVQLVEPSKEWKTQNYWLHKQTGMEVRVTRRC